MGESKMSSSYAAVVYVANPGDYLAVMGKAMPVYVYAPHGQTMVDAMNNGHVDVHVFDDQNVVYGSYNQAVNVVVHGGDDNYASLNSNVIASFTAIGGDDNWVNEHGNHIATADIWQGSGGIGQYNNDEAFSTLFGNGFVSGVGNNVFNFAGGGGGGEVHVYGANNHNASLTLYGDTDATLVNNDNTSVFLYGDGSNHVSITQDHGSAYVMSIGTADQVVEFFGQAQGNAILDGGNDIIKGGAGGGYFSGGGGDDVFVSAQDSAPNHFWGGAGNDLAVVEQGDVVDLGSGFNFLTPLGSAHDGVIVAQNFNPWADMVDATHLGVSIGDVYNLPSNPWEGNTGVFINGPNLKIEGNLSAENVATLDHQPVLDGWDMKG